MRMQSFLEHHGLADNPFTQEDAKEDLVFQKGCIDHTFHPSWGKIYGNPEEPSAALVLGERGSGKTALRYQIVEHLRRFNKKCPDQAILIVEYHDFNPFLDEFAGHGTSLADWQLPDHIDCILSLGTRQLIDAAIGDGSMIDPIPQERFRNLNRQERRDLFMLALAYDHSDKITRTMRWKYLQRAIRYPSYAQRLAAKKEVAFGIAVSLVVGMVSFWMGSTLLQNWLWVIPAVLICSAWIPAMRRRRWAQKLANEICQNVRVVRHDGNELRQLLLGFVRPELTDQPLARFSGNNSRYRLIEKLRGIAKRLGYAGIIAIVDRVDEPTSVKGDTEKMFQLMHSIFDLKFLKHPGIGIKLLLPAELYRPIRQRLDDKGARLDKQNFIPSLEWTGNSLHDLVDARLRACASGNTEATSLRKLMDESISDVEVIDLLEKLKIPRHAFKFMDRLLRKHCQSHTDARPVWKVARDTFVEAKTEFLHEVKDYDRGLPV